MKSYTEDDVRRALNDAANDIQGLGLLSETHSAVDLVVLVAISYLTGSADCVADAIEENYGEPLAEVLGWSGIS